ncbi:NADH-quinone oxidoreductase subunit C [Dyella sp.]|uniref:NADH-quinone oxidoreductase subunit C n=1 Tax=Dyella sp. TaxID=1869338 RepID=UPI002FD8B341
MSDTQTNSLAERLAARFGDKLAVSTSHGAVTAVVDAANLLAVVTALRDEAGFRFSELVDLCGVDYLGYGQTEWDTTDVSGNGFSRGVEGEAIGRFSWDDRPREVSIPKRYASVFHLLSIELNQRLRVRVFCDDNDLPVVPSLTGIHPGVNWFEREAFDLFGIIYEGHPDLRRILTDYGFVGHPFRKDFPLIGNVEVRYDPEQKRVIYEPVSIEPRVLVPRVIRDDADLMQAKAEAADHWREN